MKHSIVFLEYDPDGINRETTMKSLMSVVEHSGKYDFELIHVKNVKGFVNAVNYGLTQAKGDHIAFVANDVMLEDYDWLSKLEGDHLAGWRFTPFFITGEMRPDFACWGLSDAVLEKVGLMDTRFQDGYGFDDDDYIYRTKAAGFPIHDAGIKLTHLESLTYKTVFKDQKEAMTSRNESLFREKWNLPTHA